MGIRRFLVASLMSLAAMAFLLAPATASFEPISMTVPLHATIPDGSTIAVMPVSRETRTVHIPLLDNTDHDQIVGGAYRHIDPGRSVSLG